MKGRKKKIVLCAHREFFQLQKNAGDLNHVAGFE
jgi:hypothetical protein